MGAIRGIEVLHRIERFFVNIAILADSATLAVSFVFAYWLRATLHSFGDDLSRFSYYASWFSLILPIFIGWLAVFGLYRSVSLDHPMRMIGSIIQACLFSILTILTVLYMVKEDAVSRLVINFFAVTAVVGLSVERLGLRLLINQRAMLLVHDRWRRRNRPRWEVLLVAEPQDAQAYLTLIETHRHWGIDISAVIHPSRTLGLASAMVADGGSESSVAYGVDWDRVLDDHEIDEVVTVAQGLTTGYLLDLQEACADRGLLFRMLVTIPQAAEGRYQIADVGSGRYLVSLEPVPRDPLPLAIKRIMDVLGASIGLVICVGVYLWYAPRLRRESPGPVLFSHHRTGRNGRPFLCHKFRTMVVGAEDMQNEMSSQSKFGAAFCKLENDPRITPAGAWMRKHYLDELPQFWNVLRGDMSLVGPRPSPVIEATYYIDWQRRRLSMKPGLTGLFQIKGHRAVEDFDEVVKLDCEYIDNWSLWLDVKVIWLTAAKLLRADGL